MYAPVSATTGEGIDNLLEMLALQAEVLELKADVARPARGVVIEARRSEGRGPVATVLVQEGTLRVGDVMVAGAAYGRIRSMSDERGNHRRRSAAEHAGGGLRSWRYAVRRGQVHRARGPGERARDRRERLSQKRADARAERKHVSLENLMESFQAGEAKELQASSSRPTCRGRSKCSTGRFPTCRCRKSSVRVIHSGVGGINESDVLLADASDAVVVGFNVVAESGGARRGREAKSVEIRLYNVIYHLIDEMKAALENRLEPEIREVVRGHAEVRNTSRYPASAPSPAAWSPTASSRAARPCAWRGRGSWSTKGQIDSLKHFKDDVREVREGFECGIKIEGFDDIKVGDVFEAFETEKIPRKLS